MASVSFTIPDADIPRYRSALCAYIGFTQPADVTNANAKLGLTQLLKNTVYSCDKSVAYAAVSVPALPDVT